MSEDLDALILRVRDLPHDRAVGEVDTFFRSLPSETAKALAESRPEQVGPLEGAPPELRYRANHLILVAAQQRLHALVESREATLAQRRRLVTINEMLQPAGKRLDVDADGKRVEVDVPRQFLLVEPEGQGRMIEVQGDLRTARNIAVLVPGMNNDLERVRSQSVRAKEIGEEAGPGTATVVWLGYHAPLGLTEGRSTESSRAAAPLLCRFQEGLAVVAPDAKITLIGNSYGAQVVSRAMLERARAHRYLLTGSPGADPRVTSAAQMTPPGTELFAVARSRGDYVSYAEQHGPDPASFPDVVRIETDNERVQITGHMGYFNKNSESMTNVGRIVRGDLDAITLAARTTPAEESRVLGTSWAGPLRTLGQSKAAVPISKVFDGLATLRTVASTPSRKTVLESTRRSRTQEGPER
ncbi:alpha/beta hydrolase family protein [Kribbella sp. VKM Ac-2569]|uniref:alpha/beta hydrolase n=1 Tax=Kribbella sp. VKM Ac-2569 TaxID=2512220 RepID=UPI00102CBC8C|nr:alpha/beta hydrolase [Kribbella sp. VKM Ac-2569]RZT12956.1 alpha/beta hydrolase family protein [Kribbella sp. VKM Ac-2569]